MNLPKSVVIPIVLSLLLSLDETHGTIEGRVLARDGTPGANMVVEIRGLYPPATLKREVRTDSDGYYTAPGLGVGQYAIYTFGDSEWFPPRVGSFMQAAPDARAVVGPSQSLLRNLVLPLPAARLQGMILDVQGHPVSNVKVVLCHADDAERSADLVATDKGVFTSYVPSRELLSALVVAPSGVALQQTGIVLQPEEKQSITLRFRKETTIAGKRCVPVVKP